MSTGRPRSGSIYTKDGILQVAILTDRPGAPRQRWVRPCPPGKDGQALTRIEAKKIALDLQREYDAGLWDPWAPKPDDTALPAAMIADETVDQWFERWMVHRKDRIASWRTDASRYATHVAPMIGKLPIRTVRREHIEDLVERLDRQVQKKRLAWKTATSAWGIASMMFRAASSAKQRSLRVRPDNPTLGVEPPDRGLRKVKQFLWPSEFLALVRCPAVPLEWRRVYALLVYTGARMGEIEALKFTDIDLQKGIVHLHVAMDYDTGQTKTLKGRESRRFNLEPNVLPLLERLLLEANGAERVWPAQAVRNNDAQQLRKHLRLAGVTRTDLYTDDETRKQMTAHDLRATSITWWVIRGDSPSMVQRRAGHRCFATTDGYVRQAEMVSDGFGAVFPPLPPELLGLPPTPDNDDPQPSPGSLATIRATLNGPVGQELLQFPFVTLCEEGDLNPHGVTR